LMKMDPKGEERGQPVSMNWKSLKRGRRIGFTIISLDYFENPVETLVDFRFVVQLLHKRTKDVFASSSSHTETTESLAKCVHSLRP
jgi:hypothetical protein